VDTTKHNSSLLLRLVKRTELLLFVLVLPFLFAGKGDVRGSFVVAGVQSHILLSYGDDKYEFDTYKTELLDAIEAEGITTYHQDVFNISRETKLYGQSVTVNITKSLPVVINDEGEHIIGRTVYSDPTLILEQNDIEYWPEDILSIELILDPITAGGVGQLVTIKRAPVYTVSVDGKKKEVRSWDDSVKKIIELSNTKINPNDIIRPGLKESVASGDTIKITRINYAKVSETKTIPFETIYQGTTLLAFGQTKAAVSGVSGIKKITYNVTYKNGEEVSRKIIATKITKYSRNAKILTGVKTGQCNWGPYYETNYGPYTTSFHYPGYVGRYILVTNMANGKSVKVKIVDVGPVGALLDLSTTAMRQIGGSMATFHGHIDNVMVQLLD
jgi:uncharacterized protein YabE (DUF348 family)